MKDIIKEQIKKEKRDILFDSLIIIIGLFLGVGIHMLPFLDFICSSSWSELIIVGGLVITIGVIRLSDDISNLRFYKKYESNQTEYLDTPKEHKKNYSLEKYDYYSYKKDTNYSKKIDDSENGDCGCLLWIIILLLLGSGK